MCTKYCRPLQPQLLSMVPYLLGNGSSGRALGNRTKVPNSSLWDKDISFLSCLDASEIIGKWSSQLKYSCSRKILCKVGRDSRDQAQDHNAMKQLSNHFSSHISKDPLEPISYIKLWWSKFCWLAFQVKMEENLLQKVLWDWPKSSDTVFCLTCWMRAEPGDDDVIDGAADQGLNQLLDVVPDLAHVAVFQVWKSVQR